MMHGIKNPTVYLTPGYVPSCGWFIDWSYFLHAGFVTDLCCRTDLESRIKNTDIGDIFLITLITVVTFFLNAPAQGHTCKNVKPFK